MSSSSPSSSSSASRSSFTLVSAQPSSSGYGLNFGRGTWAHPPFSSFPIFGQSSDLGAPWFSASHPPPAAPHNSEVNIESDYENFLSADEDSEEERPVLKSPESSESVFANINKTDNFFDKVSGFYRQNINPIVHPTATRQNSAVWFFVRNLPPSAPEAPGPSIPEDGDQNADTMEQDVQDKQNLPGPGPATLQMRNLNLQPDVSMEED
ncbi:hypothetical protein B9Z55_027998 [Caenorhabditis nigoni]|uniref:Uncharacterized protein n=1 Tax=Caenorhabditis nigoni TaxID=1611254 RepID=A0A2G5SDZ5_9PELO|nr:hypothetical protein B9Z55_027998 [Caenorhabditis nigoni]